MAALRGIFPRMVSTPIQRLTVNFSGKVRRATYLGRDYLVAPMTLIVPGVLSGSKGPLLYPPDEIIKNYRAWNGVPIVVYHPHRLGQPVSATEPGIIDAQGVGVVRNATSNGKLRAEGWFDAAKTQKVNPGVYNRLVNHKPIELSTGLYTDNEDSSGTFNGRQYVAVARNYRPDHLAILPDQVGACSVKDGCGVLVNSDGLGQKLRLLANTFCATGQGGGRDNSCGKGDSSGGSESYDDRIEGTQKEADREVHRAHKNVVSLKDKLAKLQEESDVNSKAAGSKAAVDYLQSRLDDVGSRKADLIRQHEASKARIASLKAKLKSMKHNEENPMSIQDKLASLLGNKECSCDEDSQEENCDMEKNCDAVKNSNPEGINQYTKGGGGRSEESHEDRYARLTREGHRVQDMKNDPSTLKAYEEATKGNATETPEQTTARLAKKKQDIEYERDHGKMSPLRNRLSQLLGNDEEDVGERVVELKTDNPRQLAQDAEDHDLINDKAKSPAKKLKAAVPDKRNLRKVEQDNEDTDVDVQNLNQKLSSLVGNAWGPGGPPQGPPAAAKPPMPPQQQPPAPQAPPTQPQPPLDPNVWLQKQLALLIAKYQQMSSGNAPQPPQPPAQRPQQPPQPLRNKLNQLVDNDKDEHGYGSNPRGGGRTDPAAQKAFDDAAMKMSDDAEGGNLPEGPGMAGLSQHESDAEDLRRQRRIHNQEGGPTMADVKLTENEREAVVDGLITNESCCWEENDREVLNGLSDVTLAKLYKQQEIIANAGASADQLDEDSDSDVAVEEEPTKKGQSQADGKEQPVGELNPKMAQNALSTQDRRDLAFARRYRMEQRQQHVKVITANANNKFTAKQLESMDDTVLANLASLAQDTTENEEQIFRPSFFGQQGVSAVTNAKTDEEPLTLGRIDFKELSASNGHR